MPKALGFCSGRVPFVCKLSPRHPFEVLLSADETDRDLQSRISYRICQNQVRRCADAGRCSGIYPKKSIHLAQIDRTSFSITTSYSGGVQVIHPILLKRKSSLRTVRVAKQADIAEHVSEMGVRRYGVGMFKRLA